MSGPYTGTPLEWPTGSEISDTKTGDWWAVLLALTGSWTTFAPTVNGSSTDPTFTSAVGGYIKVGKLVIFHINLVFNSSGSGTYSVSLPVTSNEATGSPIGVATCAASAGAVRFLRSAWQNNSTSMALAAEDGTRVSSTVPISFNSGTIISIKGTYEGA